MRRGTWAAKPEELLARSRYGAITVAALAERGVPPRTAYRRCAPGGPWQRLLPGVVLLHATTPTRRQLVEAALLYGGAGAMVTGLEACRRHGLRSAPDETTVHLLVPHERHLKSADHVVVERTIRYPRHVMQDGVPLAPLSRSVLDAARRLRAHELVRALITEAVQRRRTPPGLLLEELERGSQRGSAVPREVLKDVCGGARSVAEVDAMRVWERTGLPALEWNTDVFDGSGRFVARPDGWCDEVALAWEIDSYEYHFDRDGYDRTLQRNARYAAAGILVVQTVPRRLREEPDAVAAELVAAHHAAAARSRPPVSVRRAVA